jgi:hypothetical protein
MQQIYTFHFQLSVLKINLENAAGFSPEPTNLTPACLPSGV